MQLKESVHFIYFYFPSVHTTRKQINVQNLNINLVVYFFSKNEATLPCMTNCPRHLVFADLSQFEENHIVAFYSIDRSFTLSTDFFTPGRLFKYLRFPPSRSRKQENYVKHFLDPHRFHFRLTYIPTYVCMFVCMYACRPLSFFLNFCTYVQRIATQFRFCQEPKEFGSTLAD
jgi:hypothetical protein